MIRVARHVLVFTVGLGIAGCDSKSRPSASTEREPKDLRDCLLRAMEHQKDAAALSVAKNMCESIFVEKPTPLPSGTYWYISSANACLELGFDHSGSVSRVSGYCASSGRIERLHDGGVVFTCLGFNGKPENRVFSVVDLGATLDLESNGEHLALHKALATCVRTSQLDATAEPDSFVPDDFVADDWVTDRQVREIGR